MKEKQELHIAVALGVLSAATGEAMYFDVGEGFTGFGGDYTEKDLIMARAVFTDLLGALNTKLGQMKH